MFSKLLANLIGRKTEYLIAQLRTGFQQKKFDSKHDLNVYFKPSKKHPDFEFLPLPSKPVWLKNPYLKIKLSQHSLPPPPYFLSCD
jgi:hypothetical protein